MDSRVKRDRYIKERCERLKRRLGEAWFEAAFSEFSADDGSKQLLCAFLETILNTSTGVLGNHRYVQEWDGGQLGCSAVAFAIDEAIIRNALTFATPATIDRMEKIEKLIDRLRENAAAGSGSGKVE